MAGIFGLHPQVIPAFLGGSGIGRTFAARRIERTAFRPSFQRIVGFIGGLAAIATGNYLAAGFLAFFLKAANLILSRTAWGAQRAIRELVRLTPDLARVVEAGGQEVEKRLAELSVGSIVRVRPGENLPVDGRIVSGTSDINKLHSRVKRYPSKLRQELRCTQAPPTSPVKSMLK